MSKVGFPVPSGRAFPYTTWPPYFHMVVEDKHFYASTVIQGMTLAHGMEF